AEGEIGVALDRHAIAVIDPTQVAEPLVPGYRSRFARYALHHVAVAAQHIDVVVEQREILPIEVLSKPPCRDCHADAGGTTLTQRPCGRLHPRGQVILWMPRTLAADLPEVLDVVERDCRLAETLVFGVDSFDAGKMQHGIEEHGSVAVR